MKIIATIDNKPGSLHILLGRLCRYGANLTYIHSHPVSGHIGQAVFFIEMEENERLQTSNEMGCFVTLHREDIRRVEEFPDVVTTNTMHGLEAQALLDRINRVIHTTAFMESLRHSEIDLVDFQLTWHKHTRFETLPPGYKAAILVGEDELRLKSKPVTETLKEFDLGLRNPRARRISLHTNEGVIEVAWDPYAGTIKDFDTYIQSGESTT